MTLTIILFLLFITCSLGNVFLHNPRGSNNRLNEANLSPNAYNRLFDSQNSPRGGYCYGPSMSYYEGSLLPIEWTSLPCGDSDLYCTVIIQYMCQSSSAPPTRYIRDGLTASIIPDNENGPTALDLNGNFSFGLHEPYEFYQACKARDRNKGLWIADREEEGGLSDTLRDSRYTRQNNNGFRNGYECPEERDYYPYWAPSPWKDIAILTNNEEYCEFYRNESQNVKGRGYCHNPGSPNSIRQQNNRAECIANSGQWTVSPPLGGKRPDCFKPPNTRDTSLGGSVYDWINSYNWTLPTAEEEPCIAENSCNCVLRIRYNVTSSDLGENANNPETGFIDWRSNGVDSPIRTNQIVEGSGILHQLAIDTSQFGRTFQDRSYVFHIRPRGDHIPREARIHNINVKGKRGLATSVHPAVPYGFVPGELHVNVGDYVHFQWTGCDTNQDNWGEGTPRTDRSNVVQISGYNINVPASNEWIRNNTPLFEDEDYRRRMALVDQVGCLSFEELMERNNNNIGAVNEDVQNCMKLNAGPAYFDGDAIPMNISTTPDKPFYYMCTRNRFAHVFQKGTIHVHRPPVPPPDDELPESVSSITYPATYLLTLAIIIWKFIL